MGSVGVGGEYYMYVYEQEGVAVDTPLIKENISESGNTVLECTCTCRIQ